MATLIEGPGGSPVPSPDEGRMALVDHLRELRTRLVKSIIVFVLAAIVAFIYNQQLLKLLIDPFTHTINTLRETRNLQASINYGAVSDPFTIPFKIAMMAALVASSPFWVYQLWAFITPGLYRNERRWALIAVGTTVPLFLTGVLLCYWLLPRGLTVIMGFTPKNRDISNIVSFPQYLDFVLRLELVFGLAFLLPIFLIMLNLVGVFSGKTMSNARPWIVFGIFVFAAVATPTADPFTMLALAIPMWLLYEIAAVVCKVNDRRRAKRLVEIDRMANGEDIP